ncbi:Pentatricopeptide repeat-containing protein [Arachis hypogaea]|nr:Pentatricopeptide repeat-containing protein [Arachis hypogaea]
MLEKSFAMDFVPDIVSVTKVVEGLCKAGRVTEAAEVLDRVECMGASLDVVAYNTLIKGFCGVGKVKVGIHFLKQMESRGSLPNVDTYNILISGFCYSGMLDLALDLFNDMKTDGIRWNFATFDTIIRGLCSKGRIDEGFSILELMEESKEGSGGHISPYNSIIYGLFKQNRFDEAVEFLTKLGKMFPRAVDRSMTIFEHCKQGSIDDAKRVYDQMIDEGGVPSILVYDCLVHRLSENSCVREAVELMNEMIANNCFPVPSTFNAIIAGFCRQEKVESALKFMEDITARECETNAETYGPLINVTCKKGDLQKALQLFLEMKFSARVTRDCFLPGNRNPDWLTFVVYSSSPNNVPSQGPIVENLFIINHTKTIPYVYDGDTLASLRDEEWQKVISNLEAGDKVQIVFISYMLNKLTKPESNKVKMQISLFMVEMKKNESDDIKNIVEHVTHMLDMKELFVE